METTRSKVPRGRKGGRTPGAKDKQPRKSRGLQQAISLRLDADLLARVQRLASLQGQSIPDFLRSFLDEHLPAIPPKEAGIIYGESYIIIADSAARR